MKALVGSKGKCGVEASVSVDHHLLLRSKSNQCRGADEGAALTQKSRAEVLRLNVRGFLRRIKQVEWLEIEDGKIRYGNECLRSERQRAKSGQVVDMIPNIAADVDR